VLVTPVARRSFDAAGKARADFAEYSAVMRELAATTATPLIDLEGASRNLLDRMGADKAVVYYMNLAPGAYPAFAAGLKDDTHFTELGARAMADLVAEQLSGLSVPAARAVWQIGPIWSGRRLWANTPVIDGPNEKGGVTNQGLPPLASDPLPPVQRLGQRTDRQRLPVGHRGQRNILVEL
jgi:hypothetical protein